jgi:hypothetical protein
MAVRAGFIFELEATTLLNLRVYTPMTSVIFTVKL